MQSANSKRSLRTVLQASAALLIAGITFPVHAALERVGPRDPSPAIGTYPAWYQDKTGLSLEFCAPQNQTEIDAGWCNMPVGGATLPESFPTNFTLEHFYNAASADLTSRVNGQKMQLIMALEASGNTPDTMTLFARIRLRVDPAPATGTYRFIHPYGEDIVDGVAGQRISYTEDYGLGCADFSCVLNGRYGPFLVPSNAPGGAELPAVAGPVPGKLYLADPVRLGPVTGSALPDFTDSTGALRNHNIFRIEGPKGSNLDGNGHDFIETTDFTVMGRVFTGSIPGRVAIDRANYAKSASGTLLDVYANGTATNLSRLPTQPRPAPVFPQLSFYPAACGSTSTGALTAPAGISDVQMMNAGTSFWAEIAPVTIPSDVCVKDAAARDASGAVVPAYFQTKVTDRVAVSQAAYDAGARTLTVSATSSDTVALPTLTVDGFGQTLAGGQVVIPALAAPPSKVRVVSSAGGATELEVTPAEAIVAPPPAGAIVAANDSFTFPEDTPVTIDLLANDTGAAAGTVTIVSAPKLGTATVNADGTVAYTPNPNMNGADGFTYQVTVGTDVSNVANVSLDITPVNDPSTAVDDGPFTVQAGAATQLPNLIYNDIDADGADLVAAADLTQPAGATVTGGAGGIVTFTAALPGTYTFTYHVVDRAGVHSANAATVTVNVVGGDVVVVSSAQFRNGQKRWVISGSDDQPNQLIHLTYVDGPNGGFEIGTVQAGANGTWTFDTRNVSGISDPTTLNPQPTRIRATSALGGTGTVAITYR
ncbi:MAG: cadherin-like domain-containing protein [Myxococcales bacterium]